MIDLNAGYNSFDAYQASKLWEQFNIKWLEEPLNPNHTFALADLKAKSNIPIASGENEFRLYGFKDLFDKKAVNVAMPDIARVGGIQETKNISILAESYGVPVSPHNFSSGILLAATIQLMASTPNTILLEMDTSNNAIYEELLIEPLEFRNGYVNVPQHPGLGVILKKEIIEKAVFRREAPIFITAAPTFLNIEMPPDIMPVRASNPTLRRLNDLLDDSAASAASSNASSSSLALSTPSSMASLLLLIAFVISLIRRVEVGLATVLLIFPAMSDWFERSLFCCSSKEFLSLIASFSSF